MAGEAATAPTGTNHSLAFLCGTFTAAGKDKFLAQGKKWAKEIAKKAGGPPIAQVGDLVEDASKIAATITSFSQAAATASPSADVLKAQFNGLRGHTLVFVTHGIPASDSDTQGLVFFNFAAGDHPSDRNMLKFHLNLMEVKDKKVVTKAELATIEVPDEKGNVDKKATERVKQDVTRYAQVLDAIRQSIFTQVYFAACGTDHRLEDFAKSFKALTGKTIFFNGDPITVDDEPVQPFASVNKLTDKKNHTFATTPSTGKVFYGDTSVSLKSETDTFLPGSQNRLP